jgi:Amt family ammonium transporter
MTTLIGFAIHKSIGMRVSEADELSGIDVTEHAETAYELLMVGGSFHPGDPHARTEAAPAHAAAQAEAQPEAQAEAEGEAARGRVSS